MYVLQLHAALLIYLCMYIGMHDIISTQDPPCMEMFTWLWRKEEVRVREKWWIEGVKLRGEAAEEEEVNCRSWWLYSGVFVCHILNGT